MGHIETAITDLIADKILDERKDLAPLGKVSTQLPVETGFGRMVLMRAFFRCLDNAPTLNASVPTSLSHSCRQTSSNRKLLQTSVFGLKISPWCAHSLQDVR